MIFHLMGFIYVSILMVLIQRASCAPNDVTLHEECISESGYDGGFHFMKDFTSMPRTLKCYFSCLAQKRGMLRYDGSIDYGRFRDFLEMRNLRKHEIQNHLQTLEYCSGKVQPVPGDLCELTYLLMECIFRNPDLITNEII